MRNSVKSLKLSLEKVPTAKTVAYLKRAYETLVKQKEIEIPRPQITFNDFWTRDDPIIFSGTVEDEIYMESVRLTVKDKIYTKSVRIKDKAVFLLNSSEDLKKNVSFKRKLYLSEGQYIVTLKAENVAGGITRHQVNVGVDRSGPMIIVDNKQWKKMSSGDRKVSISGSLNDGAGILDFFINKQRVSIQEGRRISFNETLISKADTDTIELIAHDRLGNQTVSQIDLMSSSISNKSVLFASTNLSQLQSDAQSCTDSPDIKISKLLIDSRKVYNERDIIDEQLIEVYESIKIDFRVVSNDESMAVELWINEVQDLPKMEVKNSITINDYEVKLKNEGINTVTIKAINKMKKKSVRTLLVEKRTYDALDERHRLGILAFPFRQFNWNNEEEISEVSINFQPELISALKEITTDYGGRRFRVYGERIDMKERDGDKFFQNDYPVDIFSKSEDAIIYARSQWHDRQIRCVAVGKIHKGLIQENNSTEYEFGTEVVVNIRDITKDPDMRMDLSKLEKINAFEWGNNRKNEKDLEVQLAERFEWEFPFLADADIQCNEPCRDKKIVTTFNHKKLKPKTKLIAYNKPDNRITGYALLTTPPNGAILYNRTENFRHSEDKLTTE